MKLASTPTASELRSGPTPAPNPASDVAKVAYQLFEKRGRRQGHDLEDWLEAERQISAKRASATGAKR